MPWMMLHPPSLPVVPLEAPATTAAAAAASVDGQAASGGSPSAAASASSSSSPSKNAAVVVHSARRTGVPVEVLVAPASPATLAAAGRLAPGSRDGSPSSAQG